MTANSLKPYPGKFITIEGVEGVGKTTAMQYIEQYLHEHHIEFVSTREPGGTPIAEAIRQLILQEYEETMVIDTELLLLFAGRAQHLHSVIIPALASGKWVISDRFTDASYAYQGGGRGINDSRIQCLEQWVQKGLVPDLTLLLDAPLDTCLARIQQRGQLDRIEKEHQQFFQHVQQHYHLRAKQFPQRFRLINTEGSLTAVQIRLTEVMSQYIEQSHG